MITEIKQKKYRKGGNTMEYLKNKTTEELIEMYAWEKTRINKDDMRIAHKSIKKELKRRFDTMMRLLDDEQTTQNPKGTYRRLIEG